MSRFFTLLTGAAVGYVLGARAGKHRYEQIKATSYKVWENDRVQSVVHRATDTVKDAAAEQLDNLKDVAVDQAERVKDAVVDGAEKVATKASEKISKDTDPDAPKASDQSSTTK